MLRSLEDLQLIESHTDGLEIEMGTQGEMVEMTLYLQAFELEEA